MDLRSLNYFVVIVETGSFMAASRKLRISQPALGASIKKLEGEMGAPLVIRHARGVQATDTGLVLLEHARALLEQAELAIAAIRNHASEPRGAVALGFHPGSRAMLASYLVRRLALEAPEIKVNIVEEMSALLMEWVATGRLDMAVGYSLSELPGVRSERLFRDPLFFLQRSEHPGVVTMGEEVSFQEVARHPLIMTIMSQAHRRTLREAASDNGVQLNVIQTMQSITTVVDLVAQGAGTAIMPFGVAEREIETGTVTARRIVEPEIHREVCLLISDKRPLAPAELFVRQELVGLIRKLKVDRPHIWAPSVSRTPRPSRPTHDIPLRVVGTSRVVPEIVRNSVQIDRPSKRNVENH